MAKTEAPTLSDVLADIKKITPKGGLMEGVVLEDIPRVKVTAHQLNLAFTGGGCPRGRIIEFYGKEGAGKSTSSLVILASFQRADERPVFYIDAEGTYDPIWAKKLGVDNDRVILWRPGASTAEEVFQKCLDVIDTDGISLMVLDSFPALVPMNQDEKSMEEKTMAGLSAPLTVFSTKLAKSLIRHPSISFIGINQVRDNMTQYGDPTTTPGGHAWKHFCSVRFEVRSTPVDDAGKDQPDKSDAATGVRITNFLKKNKTGPRDWKTTSFVVNFINGFNEKLDLVDTALQLGIVEQKGSSYSFTNQETGELIKAIGKRALLEKLSDDDIAFLDKAVLSCAPTK